MDTKRVEVLTTALYRAAAEGYVHVDAYLTEDDYAALVAELKRASTGMETYACAEPDVLKVKMRDGGTPRMIVRGCGVAVDAGPSRITSVAGDALLKWKD